MKKILKFCFIKIMVVLMNLVYLVFKIFPTRNKITMISRQDNRINIDFKYLENGIKRSLNSYKVVIMCKKIENNALSKVLYILHLIVQMYHFATSKIVITDSYSLNISLLYHKKSLKIIQIWHAVGLMKKAGYAILNKNEGRTSNDAYLLKMHKNYDYILVSSKNCIAGLSEVFNYDYDKMIVSSLPRVDFLKTKNSKLKSSMMITYPQIKDKLNILYTPTYRVDETEMSLVIEELINKFDFNSYNLIIKLHPLSKIKIIDKRVMIILEYNTLEILNMSDIVITDYSSIIFEAMIAEKPVYFFTFDYDKYEMNRDFFIDFKYEIPGTLHKNVESLLEGIAEKNVDEKKQKEFLNKYVMYDINEYSCTNKIIHFLKEILED